MVKRSRRSKAKQKPVEIDEDFESQLQLEVTPVVSFDLDENPMILMGDYNPRIIMDYRVAEPAVVPEADIDARPVISERKRQARYAQMASYRERFKRAMWDSLVPALIGFQLAEAEVNAEMIELFNGGEPPVGFGSYRKALQDTATAACIRQVADIFNLSTHDAELILRSKLDEQANRSRPNAQPGERPRADSQQRLDPTR